MQDQFDSSHQNSGRVAGLDCTVVSESENRGERKMKKIGGMRRRWKTAGSKSPSCDQNRNRGSGANHDRGNHALACFSGRNQRQINSKRSSSINTRSPLLSCARPPSVDSPQLSKFLPLQTFKASFRLPIFITIHIRHQSSIAMPVKKATTGAPKKAASSPAHPSYKGSHPLTLSQHS